MVSHMNLNHARLHEPSRQLLSANALAAPASISRYVLVDSVSAWKNKLNIYQ